MRQKVEFALSAQLLKQPSKSFKGTETKASTLFTRKQV